ncbi:MAG: DUF2231 domain-containing protein [Planctomycetota bacterium]
MHILSVWARPREPRPSATRSRISSSLTNRRGSAAIWRCGRLALAGALLLFLAARAPAQEAPSESAVANELCPVLTEEPVDPAIYADFRGERVFFCCPRCRREFLADPAAYLAHLPSAMQERLAAPAAEERAPAEEHDHSHPAGEPAHGAIASIAWIGKLHPLAVHFPIALLLLAALAELLAVRSGSERLAFAARFSLWGGAIGAVVAAALGWADALGVADWYSGFSARLLTIHRWTGTATALVAALTVLAAERALRAGSPRARRLYRAGLLLGALLVAVSGHLGASLIFGWDYLTR